MDLNTCTVLTENVRVIAAYAHIVPAAFMLFLGFYALFKTKYSHLAIFFFAFTASVSLWLLGDLILWTIPNYYLVMFFWSWLDHINVIFFALGAYFFGVLARDTIYWQEKLLIFAFCLPSFFITASGGAVVGFEQVWCEATENSLITYYKLFAEWVFIVFMLWSLALVWKSATKNKRLRLVVILFAILMFFGVFSVTEYMAVSTGIYEIHLYSLFVLPLFLIALTFSITNLGVFNIRYLGTQLLVYILILMVGSQFLFIQDSTDLTLNVITLGISIFLGLALLQNSKRELQQKELAQNLATELAGANTRLERLDKMKSEFVSIASHQLRSPLTSIRGYISMILEGTYGEINPKAKEVLHHVADASRHMALSIEDYLNVSRIEAGNMKYEITDYDLKKLVEDVVIELLPVADKKGIKLDFVQNAVDSAIVKLDVGKSRQIVQNLIDNALKYTKGTGSITVSVRTDKHINKVYVDITDHGIGISPESLEALFQKFERAKNVNEINVTGTGLGLYIARTMARAMGGDIIAASPGENQGSTFTFVMPLNGIEGKW